MQQLQAWWTQVQAALKAAWTAPLAKPVYRDWRVWVGVILLFLLLGRH
jgi:hypothetical protein